MKAYLAIKYHQDNKNRPEIEAILAVLEHQGFDTVCVVRDLEKWGQLHFSPQELMQKTFAEIATSDIVIIELTEKGVGLGIEAGYAWASQKPIITIARKGADISTTLQGISQQVLWYEDPAALAEFFTHWAESIRDGRL